MKHRILSTIFALFLAATSLFGLVGCQGQIVEKVDYAAQVTLDLTSNTQKAEATVKNFVDGDTTHFKVNAAIPHVEKGILKARYAAVNTPESTGKIEEWGKKAAKFTRSKLENAVSIMLESDGAEWEVDSTGERHLVWVWYKSSTTADYRCLNIELLQEGLALGSKAGDSRYGNVCNDAIAMATNLKLHVFSDEKDPDFFYGEARPLGLKELRTHTDDYVNSKVSFEGYVVGYSNQGVYVQNFDEETQRYFSMYVYYGFFLDPMGQRVLEIGNHVRIVGSVQYWEAGDSYQVTDLSYDARDKDNPKHIKKLDNEFHETVYMEIDPATFLGDVTLKPTEEGEVAETYKYAQLSLGTAVEMKGLRVVDSYTTNNGGDNDGAITLDCIVDGKEITVRTVVLRDENNNVVTADMFEGKTLDVKGIVDYYKQEGAAKGEGEYQIKVFSLDDINIH